MESTIRQHYLYSENPVLFMEERWFGYDAFEKKTLARLNPMEYQKKFISDIHNNKFHIITQSRQMHVSSMMALYIAWYALFNEGKTIMLISDSIASGKELLNKIGFIIENYYLDKKGTLISSETSKSITLTNFSKIILQSATADAARGYSLDFLYIHNASHIKHLDDIMTAAFCAVYPKKYSKIIISSTPKDNSFFNKIFLESNEDNSSFKRMILHWTQHPIYSKDIVRTESDYFEYSSPWFEEMCKKLYSKSAIEQELECVITYNDKTNKDKTVSLRISMEMYNKLKSKLSDHESISDYIRKLIEEDCQK